MANSMQLMLKDYATELIVLLTEAQSAAHHRDTFEDGRRMGLYEALSLLLDQAKAFDIPLNEIGADNTNPEAFLK